MDNNIELLAPAGDRDAFIAAVESGADAVYLGGKLFNARQFAGNFDNEHLKKALDYAHIRGIKIYLTLNTLLTDSEFLQAVNYIEEAYLMGIDGVIVQDLGFAGFFNKYIPQLDLHASTQMTVYNPEGVKVLEQLGFKRVVLARELSLEEISRIVKNTSLEIEVFNHGALCVSYSGQCLMSSMIGGRSGNRGKCAQPCRLPYQLLQDGSTIEHKSGRYLLSTKDLCSLDELENLVKSGVKSLKIEGRMKNPEYVATVVKTYRKYLDIIQESKGNSSKIKIEKQDMKDITQIFNRGGFTTGYLKGKPGKDLMSYEKPKNWGVLLGEVLSYDKYTKLAAVKLSEAISIGDGIEIWNGEEESPGTVVTEINVNGKNIKSAEKGEVVSLGRLIGKIFKGNKVYKTSDKKLIISAREYISGKFYRKMKVTGKFIMRTGNPAEFVVWDKAGNEISAKGIVIPEKALNKPLTKERLVEQISKTGSTPFEFEKIYAYIEAGLTLPISEINDMRRRALEALEKRRIIKNIRILSKEENKAKEELLHFPGNSRNVKEKLQISLMSYHLYDNLDYSSLPVDRIYLPFSSFLKEESHIPERCGDKGMEVFLWIPSITRGNYDKLIKSRLNKIMQKKFKGILVGNLGSVELVKNMDGVQLMGDYSLNMFNSYSAEALRNLSLSGVTLSPEMTLGQIEALREFPEIKYEAIVYGRIPLMTSEYCPVGSVAGGHGTATKCNGICEKKLHSIKDRMGMEFPVFCDRIDCRSTILNSNVLFLPDSINEIKHAGIDMVRLIMTDETVQEIRDITEMHRDLISNGENVLRNYAGLIDRIKSKGFTKGHFYRGV